MVNPSEGLIVSEFEVDFETASKRIENAIEDSPANLMTVFDHRENAQKVGMDMPPTRVFVFGNPKLGTPILNEYRSLAIDLPQKMLLWEKDDRIKVAYNDPDYLFERHEVENEEAKQKISGFLETISNSVEEK